MTKEIGPREKALRELRERNLEASRKALRGNNVAAVKSQLEAAVKKAATKKGKKRNVKKAKRSTRQTAR